MFISIWQLLLNIPFQAFIANNMRWIFNRDNYLIIIFGLHIYLREKSILKGIVYHLCTHALIIVQFVPFEQTTQRKWCPFRSVIFMTRSIDRWETRLSKRSSYVSTCRTLFPIRAKAAARILSTMPRQNNRWSHTARGEQNTCANHNHVIFARKPFEHHFSCRRISRKVLCLLRLSVVWLTSFRR